MCSGVIGLAARLSRGFATGLAAYVAAELGYLAYQRWRCAKTRRRVLPTGLRRRLSVAKPLACNKLQDTVLCMQARVRSRRRVLAKITARRRTSVMRGRRFCSARDCEERSAMTSSNRNPYSSLTSARADPHALRRYHEANAVPHEAPDVTRIPEIKERFLELAGVMDLREFVSGWFHDAPFEVRVAGRPNPHLVRSLIAS